MKNSEDLRDRYKDFILFKRVLIHLKPYSSLVILAVLLLLAVSVLNLTGPYLTKIVIDDHIKFACSDGPEFDAHKVDWYELISRNKTYDKEEESCKEHQCEK